MDPLTALPPPPLLPSILLPLGCLEGATSVSRCVSVLGGEGGFWGVSWNPSLDLHTGVHLGQNSRYSETWKSPIQRSALELSLWNVPHPCFPTPTPTPQTPPSHTLRLKGVGDGLQEQTLRFRVNTVEFLSDGVFLGVKLPAWGRRGATPPRRLKGPWKSHRGWGEGRDLEATLPEVEALGSSEIPNFAQQD